jgi:DNA-directed RNA polymerase specialized sigma24 family protein
MTVVSIEAASTADENGGNDYAFEREMFKHDSEYGADAGIVRVLTSDRDDAVRRFVSRLSGGQREIVVDLFWRDKATANVARDRKVTSPAISRAMARVYDRGRNELAAYQTSLAA